MQFRSVLRNYMKIVNTVRSQDKTVGVMAISQSGRLHMWDTSPQFKVHMEVDCLYHVRNCAKILFLHYKRTAPQSRSSVEDRHLFVEDGGTSRPGLCGADWRLAQHF